MSSVKKQMNQTTVTPNHNSPIYFKKDYKLMIHNISLEQQIRSTYYTGQCANYTTLPNTPINIAVNNTIQITTIDVTSNQEERADLQVTVDVSHFARGIRNELATVKFKLNEERILTPASVNSYTQSLTNRKGTVQYKFVALKTTEITQQQASNYNKRREEVVRIQEQLAQNSQLRKLVQILDGKDDVIRTLQRKIASLIQQTRKLSHSLDRQQSQQKKKLKQGLKLHLNINSTTNNHMKLVNDKLSDENLYLQKRIDDMQQELEQVTRQLYDNKVQNNILQIQLGNRVNQPQIIVNLSKVMGRSASLAKAHEQQYVQQLLKKSKMADSMFISNADNMSMKLKSKQKRKTIMARECGLFPNVASPRGRGRSVTIVNSQSFSGLQQSAKFLNQQQVLQELKSLKQNLQLQVQGGTRYPRIQAAIKSSYRMIERLNSEKNLLQNKLKIKEQQILYMNRQLQRSKQNFRNFEKQLRQRSSNIKDQSQQRMASIKLQTQMRISQMRKQNKFSDYQTVMQQQKRQIQMQKMRYEYESLRQKHEQLMNQMRSLKSQRQNQASKFKTTEHTISKQKQMYRTKYYEMQDSFTKQEEELSVKKEKAEKFELHLQKIQELERREAQLKKKLETVQKSNSDYVKKCKRYEDKFSQIEPRWQIYRQMQTQFEMLKRRNFNLTKFNERFGVKMDELKKFSLRLQNAYYEKKSKNQNDEQFDLLYQKQMQDRLEQSLKKLRVYIRQFYEQQIKQYVQSKKQLIEFYYKRIMDQNQRIEENPTYNQSEKVMFKSQKEHQINIIKEGKLEQVEKKIKQYQQLLHKIVNSEDYLPKGLNQKVSYLEQKLRKLQLGELGGAGWASQSSQSQMKFTLDRLNDSVRVKDSEITELKRTMGKMSDGGSLLRVNNIQNTFASQRKSMIEEMAKSRQIFSKSFQDLKKANAQLLKQKSSLEIQLQNYKFKEEKLIIKNTERQRQLERMSKKTTDDFKRKIGDLQKSLEKKSDQNLKNKLQKEEFKENMTNLIGELNSTASLLQKREEDVLNSQAENQQLKHRIQQYEDAQRSLLDEVRRIKDEAAFNQRQFRGLLQERNDSFIKIERIKNVQIQKLVRTIQQLEVKLQTEVTEVLQAKRDIQTLQGQFLKVQSQLQETKVSYGVVNENYNRVQEESVLRIHELQETTQQLERNLMEMAQNLKQIQMELHQANINKDSLLKQINSFLSIKADITNQQAQFKLKQARYSDVIEEQNQKLQQLRDKYAQINQKVQEVERENQFLSHKITDKENQYQQLRQKLDRKYDEVNQFKTAKVNFQIKNKELGVEIQKYEKQRACFQEKIQVLEQQLHQLKAQVQDRRATFNLQDLSKSTRNQTGKLKAPPKTLLMNGSTYKDDELGFSKVSKTSRVNDLGASGVVSRKNIKQEQEWRLNRKMTLQQDVSIRGTQIKADLVQIQVQNKNVELFESIPQIRKRMWTVKENDEQLFNSHGDKKNLRPSRIQIQYAQQISQQNPDLDSDKSVRQNKQDAGMSKQSNDERSQIASQNQMLQSQVVGQNWKQADSMSENAAIQQFARQIQQLKQENEALAEQKSYLEEENYQLREKIYSLTINVEKTEHKINLTSALGMTGAIFMKNASRRGSIQANLQSRSIPLIKKRSGTQPQLLAPPFVSKQSIRQEQFNNSIRATSRGDIVSRKGIIHSPVKSSRLSPQQNSSIQKGASQHRSNHASFTKLQAEDNRLSNRRQSLEQGSRRIQGQNSDRSKQLQLIVQQLQEQIKQIKAAYQQQHANNQKLMQQLVICQQSQQQQNLLLQQKIEQVQQVTQFYQGIKLQLQQKIQELIQEQIQKQSQQVKLLRTFQAKSEEIEGFSKKTRHLLAQVTLKDKQVRRLSLEKQSAYTQYRMYEEEAELQILTLKQNFAAVQELNQEKQAELQLIAEDYFELKNKFISLQQQLGLKQSLITQKQLQIKQLTQLYNQAMAQARKFGQLKKSARQQINQLQNDLMQQENRVSQINKSTQMVMKKYEIKLSTSQQQKMTVKQKLTERQSIIQSLKHQIALYNQETQKLKELNEQLSLELERTEKQLKDIMKSYQSEFQNVTHSLKAADQNVDRYRVLVKQKDEQLVKLNRVVKKLEDQTRGAFDSQHQTKQTYDKYKSAKQRQIGELAAQFEMKNDQYQKVKSFHQRQSQEFFAKQAQYLKKLSLSEQGKKGYKQKLVKYQTVLEELQSQLSTMSLRPRKQQFDELQFQNQLYKNRIQELEDMLREFAPQAQSNSEQATQKQYRKYKVKKERQLQDLCNEMQKYSMKINELQESNFTFKKQIQKSRLQTKQLLQQNNQLRDENYDLKQDLTQLKEEIQFYKGKRIQSLGKLLSQTM